MTISIVYESFCVNIPRHWFCKINPYESVRKSNEFFFYFMVFLLIQFLAFIITLRKWRVARKNPCNSS